MKSLSNYINGEFVKPLSNNYLDVFEPATGQVYCKVPDSSGDDIQLAVHSAMNAFPDWSSSSIDERSSYLNTIADLLESRLDEFAQYETRDTGKPISLAKSVDISRAVSNFRFFSEYGKQYEFESKLNNDSSINTVIRSPLGVVGCISPWNLPLYLFSWKIAPALISGNTVVAKPSELTPFTAFMLGEICTSAGLPPGVLNIVHGQGNSTGNALISHKEIKAISFTGGTATGRAIATKTASMFKKLSLEMGGKNPAVIFSDCDYDVMLETVVKSSFSNQGQICLCSSRIMVEENIYNKFRKDFVEKVSTLIVGDPIEDSTQIGSITSKPHLDKVLTYIELAKEEGGIILTGGKPVSLKGRCEEGWFVEPTIIDGLPNTCRTNQEEIFGPIVTIIPFKDEADAIDIANDTEYGLSATIWTKDLDKAKHVARNIDAGVIWINSWLVRDLRTPFGGMKQSGMGREGGTEILNFFTEPKNICEQLS
ncbi:MAG: aldehyde dehydrogenase [Candidatus Marinimicrobia bacterium]|nr:aldehyde dehydrogenase [Candidatus Neomarinimicrobiota bacterium]MBL7010088.1 aldehyde dehydrogenase [Candidatus Neomarinimicrobiota bacterium]MBL7030001.1 aldehyde dehydrogenase [Candidatus Neomarinimicrobiota bacterium]